MKSCATVMVSPSVCTSPPGSLIPSADTMHVGEVVHFQIPAAQLAGRDPTLIRCKIDSTAVARVDSLTGVVTALSIGPADVLATDPSTTSPCPRDWRAPVVVR